MYLLVFSQYTVGASLLIHNDDLVWIQPAISIFRNTCSQDPSPPVYTRVSSYQEWISNVTGSSQPGFVTFPSSGGDGVSISTSSPTSQSTTATAGPTSQSTTANAGPTSLSTTANAGPTSQSTTATAGPTSQSTTAIITFNSSENLSCTFFTSFSSLFLSLLVLVV